MRRLTLTLLIAALIAGLAPAAEAASCKTPAKSWERRAPSALGLNARRLQRTLDWANVHSTASIAVYRHGCLAAQSRLDAVTSKLPLDGWSMTKTVTALLVGRAVTLGKLNVRRPIGRLFPEADRAHARLTPRMLLKMQSGLHRNWVRDLSPQPDRIRDALSLPFDHPPNSHWEYQQSPVTLLLELVRRSVGARSLTDWAQRELFGPLGIPRRHWFWLRDGVGHPEGWAHLWMRPHGWARLGQLMLKRGRWGGRRLIARSYLRQMLTPGRLNNAYGYLTWLNGGGRFVMPEAQSHDEGRGRIVPAAPRDTFLACGMGEQRIYVIPSRDMVVVRLGEPGSREPDTRVSLWTGRAGQLDHELMRGVMSAVKDVPYKDPGPYRSAGAQLPSLNQGILGDLRNLNDVLAGLGLGPAAPK